MTAHKRIALAFFAVVVIAAAGPGVSLAGEPQNVIGENEIQARIDQQLDQADADRQAIQIMLQREEVREIAGSAGLDLERARAAAAVLSGPSLEKLAAQAREVNASLAGGDDTIVISATALIIILLLLILILR
jgi:hypothetical protein